MELGPILRALLHHKTRFWLIVLEVALTFAIVVNCVSLGLELLRDFRRPTGYDEANLIAVSANPFAPEFGDEDVLESIRDQDLEALRALPGVVDAVAITQVPLSGSGSGTGRKPLGSDLDTVHAPYFYVAGDPVATFGVDLIEGRTFTPEDLQVEEREDGGDHRNVILSQGLAQALFPDGSALGKDIQSQDGGSTGTVVGVVRYMHNSWPAGNPRANNTMIMPGRAVFERSMRYLVRTEPGAREAVFPELEGALVGVHPGRLTRVRTLEDYKQRTYSRSTGMIKMLSTVIVLLVFVTGLGIVGLTSFSVAERKRQIGTRRALGGRRVDIVRYFLLENGLLTGCGLALGLALAIGLNYALVHVVDAPRVDTLLLSGGMLFLWAVGFLAALVPALQAASVPPVIATRTV